MERIVKLRRDDKYRPIGTPLFGRKEKVVKFMAYKITDSCISCGTCKDACPVDAISEGADKYEIAEDACISCGSCASECPADAIEAD